ncbi:gamma-glutamyltransferase [Rhodohalobacter sp.]|uniref:gamma-glutamyltransferase n=1 Tax=Rhodohalobacter sp. TaxID=1974210 RepID=UPI002ACD9D8E|nr:gamma-glutamyltransferase [Rhodohalobacter sp.]MDZ7755121.1 gamma-glutamyltransferase [Rhodohalobacter sp.]
MTGINKKQTSGAIAAGHPETVKAAEQILRDGGNAYDAVIAAQLAALVAEPVLTSLGGGGFMMAETASGSQTLYDFFVQTPMHKRDSSRLSFFPITADFGEAEQEFHIGPGSVAVPGMVKGLFEIHRDLCTLPMKRLAEPAIELARKGVEMNSFQSGIFDIVTPIYRDSPEANRIFRSSREEGQLIREGEVLKQPDLAELLEQLILDGEHLFYEGEIAESISRICREDGGHLTREDFENYRVIKRDPLKINYRGNEIAINPPPSSGGILVGFALNLMESVDPGKFEPGDEAWLDTVAFIQQMTNRARIDAFVENPSDDPAMKLMNPEYLEIYKKEVRERTASFRGTTHISVVDRDGNMAGMTSSNGEGSGVMIPGTGFMFNNMLGEQDLNPGGFHSWKPNERMTSMMAPGILKLKSGARVVFGSGGSNRIRTATFQVLLNLIDLKMSLKESIEAPRVHIEDKLLHVEKGYGTNQLKRLKKNYPNHKIWSEKNLFFGGAHSVSRGPEGYSGAGDKRRGGVAVVVSDQE